MSTALATCLRCSVGGDEFQLRDWSMGRRLVFDQAGRPVGVDWRIRGEGWVDGADAADFAAKLAAARAAFVSGRDFRVWGIGQAVELELLAAACLRGGPYVDEFTIEPQIGGSALNKRFTFTIGATTPPAPSDGGHDGTTDDKNAKLENSLTMTVQTGPDGLRRITITGQLTGGRSQEFIRDEFLPRTLAKFPADKWVATSQEIKGDAADTSAEFTLEVKELRVPLPAASDAATALDGTVSTRTDRDEAMRLVRTVQYDLLIRGDPVALVQVLRPAGQPIIRESYEYTDIQDQRLRAVFVVLLPADGNALMDWEQSIELGAPIRPRVVYEYVGREPVFGQRFAAYRVSQSGRAVGNQYFVVAPEPLLGHDRLADVPRVRYRFVNAIERETTWSYEYVLGTNEVGDAADLLGRLGRPAAPVFRR